MDRRDLAASERWWSFLDRGRMRAIPKDVEYDDPEEVEYEEWVPFRWEICSSCEGRGTYVNPNIDRNGLTQADFDEQGEDFYEDYRSGVYDVRCAECDGERVIPVYAGHDHAMANRIERIVAEQQAYDYERESEMRYMYGPNY